VAAQAPARPGAPSERESTQRAVNLKAQALNDDLAALTK